MLWLMVASAILAPISYKLLKKRVIK